MYKVPLVKVRIALVAEEWTVWQERGNYGTLSREWYVYKQKEEYREVFLFSQLFYADSNDDKQNQKLLCYHYTIEQTNVLLQERVQKYSFLWI